VPGLARTGHRYSARASALAQIFPLPDNALQMQRTELP
jgi:hypothetical protein